MFSCESTACTDKRADHCTDQCAGEADSTTGHSGNTCLRPRRKRATAIVGEANSANFYFSPETYPEPTVALLDASNVIKKEPDLCQRQGQILGTFDTGMFPLPAKFTINLPIQPTATSIDLDNNGKADAGVQLFSLAIGSHLTGDSYLQQLEQADAMSSLIADVATGDITEGSFLVYAPDDKQGFPTGSGADKKWFTSDDPTAPLPQGYSVARLGADGSVNSIGPRRPR